MDKRFADTIQLIKQSHTNAIRALNAKLINLYWNIGAYINQKIEQAEWGDSVVTELAKYIQQNEPYVKGFCDKNILTAPFQTLLTLIMQTGGARLRLPNTGLCINCCG